MFFSDLLFLKERLDDVSYECQLISFYVTQAWMPVFVQKILLAFDAAIYGESLVDTPMIVALSMIIYLKFSFLFFAYFQISFVFFLFFCFLLPFLMLFSVTLILKFFAFWPVIAFYSVRFDTISPFFLAHP